MKRLFQLNIVILCGVILSACCGSSSSSGVQTTTSQAGSTATMLVHNETLYTLDKQKLNIYDLSNGQSPTLVKNVSTVSSETLFIYDDHLYTGGQTGVGIWDISSPQAPEKVSFYSHLRGCDPIVVDNDIGYVTVRNRFACGGQVNRVEIVDLSNPENPRQLQTFNMSNPYGLAKAPRFLAICQESDGLSLLNVDNIDNIFEVATYPNINCFDLIYRDNTLIATAADGIYQFDATDEFIDQLSRIPVGENQ